MRQQQNFFEIFRKVSLEPLLHLLKISQWENAYFFIQHGLNW